MNVDAILRAKGGTVTLVTPQATITEAVAVLRREGIGALVVSRDGATVDGILSERDVIHGLARLGPQLLDATVEQLMTRRVFTCTPRDSIADLMAEMTKRRIRHIPVLRDGELVGIISIGDVVKNRVAELQTESAALQEYLYSGQ